jgi:octaprenyl-diphosphate synthase
MDLRTIIAPIQDHLDRFEREFRVMFQSNIEIIDRIADHLIKTKGKRLRPALVLLSASAHGWPSDDAIRTAAIVELIHTATLVHDDVVDKAPLRRGLPSLNSIWDNHIAVLMGDYLLSKALTLIVLLDTPEMMRKISHCTERLSKGELLQATRGFDVDITEQEYYQIINDKTASLVASGCEVGAYLTSRSPEVASRFHQYGELLGMAFQITDDLLDYVGDEGTIGKPTGHDIREGTVTLPLICALQSAPRSEAERVQHLLNGDWSDTAWQHIVQFTHAYGGIAYARRKAREFAETAQSHIVDLEDSPVKQSLMAMVSYAVDRDR